MPRTPRSAARLLHRGAELRNNPTSAEARLWAYLRLKRLDGIKFRRQHAIGRYVVDFCSPEAKLVVELDGSQHLAQAEQDNRRTELLESQGYRVLRFWNHDVLNDIDAVVRRIQDTLAKP